MEQRNNPWASDAAMLHQWQQREFSLKGDVFAPQGLNHGDYRCLPWISATPTCDATLDALLRN